MGGWVNSVEMAILDDFTGKAAYTPPVTLYAGLSTTTPNESSGSFTEPVAGGYLRFQVTAATWTNATSGNPSSTSYGAAIAFAAATGGWGTVTHFGLFSVATAATGLVQHWGTLDTAKAIQTSDSASFAANTLKIYLGDPPDTYT